MGNKKNRINFFYIEHRISPNQTFAGQYNRLFDLLDKQGNNLKPFVFKSFEDKFPEDRKNMELLGLTFKSAFIIFESIIII